jgi:arylformamidase
MMEKIAAGWIDISIPLHNAMVHWPGDPPFIRTKTEDMDRGDTHNISQLSMGSHTGTHVDAPRHFIRDGIDISAMSLETLVGVARVIEIQDPRWIQPDELRKNEIRRRERLLFKTRNSGSVWENKEFVTDFVALSREAAGFLVERKVKMIGMDYLSVGPFHGEGAATHRALLGAGIWIIEGLDLSKVEAGKYQLVCLPLKIEGGDGAPARAIVKRRP